MIEVSSQVRPAVPQDQRQIANLMFFEAHVHRHLDWRAPLEWLGGPFYWVLEENIQIQAVLACPQDPQNIAWVRLFAHTRQTPLETSWDALWEEAQQNIHEKGGATVAAIAMHQWMGNLLAERDFSHTQDIVMLSWDENTLPPEQEINDLTLRQMTAKDLPTVAKIDATAFLPLWQNSLDSLKIALSQAISATVVVDSQGVLIGYQISTGNPFGAHLARLAVRPDAQRRGIGSFIIRDLIQRLKDKNIDRLTVNTQSDNHASLALYKKMGFKLTGEEYPVYCYSVP